MDSQRRKLPLCPLPQSPHLATPFLRRTIWKVNRMAFIYNNEIEESRKFLPIVKRIQQIQLITAEVISKSHKSSRDVIFTSLRISLSGKVQEMENLLVKGKGFPTCRQGNWTTSTVQSTYPPTPPTRPVFQRNQVASLNSEITHPIYPSCLDGLRNDIFHTSNTNNLV